MVDWRWLLVIPLAYLAGCSLGGSVQDSVADYNRVFGSSADSVVLTNVLRASDGLPLHFTFLNKVNGNLSESFQLGASLPFAEFYPTGTARKTLSPQITVSSNPTFEDDNLETQNFVAGISTPIDPATFKRLLDTGVDDRVGILLMVSGVRIKGRFENPVISNAPSSGNWVCHLDVTPDEESKKLTRPVPISRYLERYSVESRKQDCGADVFAEPEIFAFLRIVNALPPFFANTYVESSPFGPEFTSDKIISAGVDKLAGLDPVRTALIPTANGKAFRIATLKQMVALCATRFNTTGLNLLHSIKDGQCKTGGAPVPRDEESGLAKNLEILSTANLRSVAAMFDYVGEIIAWQRQYRDRCITLSANGTCDGDVFFKVDRAPGNDRITISYQGENLGVAKLGRCVLSPPGDAVAAPCDYSTEVLNILSLGLGLNIQPKDLPQTSLFQILP